MQISDLATDLVGYDWLRAATSVDPVQPFRVFSRMMQADTVRKTVAIGDRTEQKFPVDYLPDATLRAQLTFALKYEGVQLEFLASMFKKVGPAFIQEWIAHAPGSQYSRKVGFLYEWLTGKEVPGNPVASGNYVDAIDEKVFLSASRDKAVQNRRWRINDNLPGTPDFCPMIRLDSSVMGASAVDFDKQISSLVKEFGEERILRSVNWMTVKESRASFAIERETEHEDRIQRFARAMNTHCGRIEDPLSELSLRRLQESIIDKKRATFGTGFRRSPVFVGHNDHFAPVVDYIAPHYEKVPGMLAGLREFANRTVGRNSILRATAISFGFVYVHPMADGNGRISRFLINDTLRRDGAVPAPLILPISAIISSSLTERAHYDQALEVVSRPLMARFHDAQSISREAPFIYEDGVASNFNFTAYAEAEPVWRYMDLSSHAAYLGRVIDHSMTHGIRDEATLLAKYDQARSNLKTVMEARDEDYDRIIRSVSENGGVSKSLRKTLPMFFAASGSVEAVTSAVLRVFDTEHVVEGAAPIDEEAPAVDSHPRARG